MQIDITKMKEDIILKKEIPETAILSQKALEKAWLSRKMEKPSHTSNEN